MSERTPGEVVLAHIGHYCATQAVTLEGAWRIVETIRERRDQSPAQFLTELLFEYIQDHVTARDYERARARLSGGTPTNG